MRGLRTLAVPTLLLVATSVASAQTTARSGALSEARRLLEAEQPLAALQVLTPLTEGGAPSAEVLLLLSTAHFMLGDIEPGRSALQRSIELDPAQRQAWLNRAALDLAEERYDDALGAFQKAQELDPGAADNDINLGATFVLMGDAGRASRHFNSYLSLNRSSADAYYLVATNYALGGHWDLAVRHLEAAIRLDERSRRRSRTDANFGPLANYEPFLTLLETDSFQPAADAHRYSATFEEAYDGGHGSLLTATLNALQLSGRPFDPNVEVTDQWALIWADARLKLSNAPSGGGMVVMTAPGTLYTTDTWTRRSQELTGQIREQLALLALRRQ